MKTKDTNPSDPATLSGPRPADFPIGSPRSRAAARKLAEERDISAMQDWIRVKMENLKSAKAFARELRSPDSANPSRVRLIVRTHETQQQAEDARNRDQPQAGAVSLAIADEEEAVRLVRLFSERHGGVVIYVDVSPDKR